MAEPHLARGVVRVRGQQLLRERDRLRVGQRQVARAGHRAHRLRDRLDEERVAVAETRGAGARGQVEEAAPVLGDQLAALSRGEGDVEEAQLADRGHAGAVALDQTGHRLTSLAAVGSALGTAASSERV